MYPGKNPEGLAFSSRYLPDKPLWTDSPPTYPKLTNMFVLSGQFADVGRTLGLHCRCLRMFPGRVTLLTDVPSIFADVLTKPADLAIGDHRAPQSGQCKPGLTTLYTLYITGKPHTIRPNKINPFITSCMDVARTWLIAREPSRVVAHHTRSAYLWFPAKSTTFSHDLSEWGWSAQNVAKNVYMWLTLYCE